MSAGVIHSKEGALVQLSAIREDARGMPSPDWSDSTTAALTDAAGLAEALRAAGAPTASVGAGHSISAALEQREIREEWAASRLAAAGPEDVLLLCPDAIAIVAPARRVEGEPFSSAAAWWPRRDGSPVLYTIEARWDAQGALEQCRYLVFE